jgi:hypothetical protein
MSNRMRFQVTAFCLYCLLVTSGQARSDLKQATVPQVVRSQAQLEAALASGQRTPLDALTPYGKRRFISTLTWGSKGLGGFGFRPLVRELNEEQLSATLSFLDSSSYLRVIGDELVGAPLRLSAPSLEIEQRLLALEDFVFRTSSSTHDSFTARDGSPLLRRYGELFGSLKERPGLQAQPTEDLPLLFDDASLVAGENPASSALTDMRLIQQEMTARGIDTRRSFDGAVLTALIAAREFDQARDFVGHRPHLAKKKIPNVIDSLGRTFSGRSAFQYDATNDTLIRRAMPHASGIELVMVVDAGCHFSRDALESIRADVELQARLQKANLLLITPPASAIAPDFLASWNNANPSLQIYAPYNVREWKSLDVASVPQFFMLKDGVVVAQLTSGWPAGGNKSALVNLLNSVN